MQETVNQSFPNEDFPDAVVLSVARRIEPDDPSKDYFHFALSAERLTLRASAIEKAGTNWCFVTFDICRRVLNASPPEVPPWSTTGNTLRLGMNVFHAPRIDEIVTFSLGGIPEEFKLPDSGEDDDEGDERDERDEKFGKGDFSRAGRLAEKYEEYEGSPDTIP